MGKNTAVGIVFLSLIFSTQATSGDYKLGVGDQVRVKVFEWPDVSGEYKVGPNGSVFFSLIGQVPAANLSVAELADEVSGRIKISARIEEAPNVSVEIINFRPFFILGDIQSPGEYAYRPGLTILQAISIAGGMYRRDADLRFQRDAISSRGQLLLLQLEIDQLTARKARLEAELDELEEIKFPAHFLARQGERYIQQLLREERMLLEAENEQHAQGFEILTLLQNFYEAEAESLQDQQEAVRQQQKIAEEQLSTIQSLVSRGLAPAPRQQEMERFVLGLSANLRQLETNALRAQQSIAETKQRLLDLHWNRRNRIVAEGQRTQAALEAAREKLITTQQLIFEAEEIAPAMMQRQAFEVATAEPVYEIVRRSGSGSETLTVEENTSVEPGDVIKVRHIFEPPSVSPLPSRFGSSSRPTLQSANPDERRRHDIGD